MFTVIGFLLSICFIFGIGALLVLIWSISVGQFSMGPSASHVIFEPGELGIAEDPALSTDERAALQKALDKGAVRFSADNHLEEDSSKLRRTLDESSRTPVLILLLSAVFWLVLGSIFGLMTSFKFHYPDWLNDTAALGFGRLRPLHLSTVIYGWLSMAGMAVSLWLIPRLCKIKLQGSVFATIGAALWNVGVVLGCTSLYQGVTDGLEWLEFPWQIDIFLALSGALIGIPVLLTIWRRKTQHLYVSVWYIGAAFVWFPFLFVIANWPHAFSGVQQAIVNWWYAHNVLGLWLTPFGLSAAYYFIPKIIGKPVYSYQISLLGFWSLALFYSQVGVHHLISGPVPTWLVTVSIVTSVMMFIPVLAVAVNHHMTMAGSWRALSRSPTLAFIVSGALMYTAVSFQGSLQSLRTVNTVSHFTHATVAHAHLGVYGFVSFIVFGSSYFLLPRLLRREWPHTSWIYTHLILSLAGIIIYFVFLTIGGVLQGLAMLDPAKPFMDSVNVTVPYLWARTIGGILMTLGHVVYAFHIILLLRQKPITRTIGISKDDSAEVKV